MRSMPPPIPLFEPGEKQPAFLLLGPEGDDCLVCGYSLQGLVGQKRCPECGHEMDEQTFIVSGIPRGLSAMSKGRAALWVLVLTTGIIGLYCWQIVFVFGNAIVWMITAGGFVIWLGLLIGLLLTQKNNKSSVTRFFFSTERFGTFFNDDPERCISFAWSDAATFHQRAVSDHWQRLRIFGPRNERLVDLGYRATPANAKSVAQLISQRIGEGDVGSEELGAGSGVF